MQEFVGLFHGSIDDGKSGSYAGLIGVGFEAGKRDDLSVSVVA